VEADTDFHDRGSSVGRKLRELQLECCWRSSSRLTKPAAASISHRGKGRLSGSSRVVTSTPLQASFGKNSSRFRNIIVTLLSPTRDTAGSMASFTGCPPFPLVALCCDLIRLTKFQRDRHWCCVSGGGSPDPSIGSPHHNLHRTYARGTALERSQARGTRSHTASKSAGSDVAVAFESANSHQPS
jgi:hypothetical protein